MYDKTIDKHTFSVLLGQSAKKNTGSYLRGTRNNIINYSRPYINASTGQAADGDQTAAGAPSEIATLASLLHGPAITMTNGICFRLQSVVTALPVSDLIITTLYSLPSHLDGI